MDHLPQWQVKYEEYNHVMIYLQLVASDVLRHAVYSCYKCTIAKIDDKPEYLERVIKLVIDAVEFDDLSRYLARVCYFC